MSAESTTLRKHRPWGVLLLAIAIFIAAVSVGIIPLDESTINVPRWVLMIVSGTFALASVLVFVGQDSRAGDLIAGIVLLSMALIGGWISIFGSTQNLAGGLVFLPIEANIVLARALFGVGAILTLGIFIYAIRRALQRDMERIQGTETE